MVNNFFGKVGVAWNCQENKVERKDLLQSRQCTHLTSDGLFHISLFAESCFLVHFLPCNSIPVHWLVIKNITFVVLVKP